MKYRAFLFITSLFLSPVLLANDITISNVQITEKSIADQWLNISFDLSVANSWRINTGAANWNAAWVFVKYKIGVNGQWHHATLSTIDNEHFAPANTTIDATADGKGAFIYDSRENAGIDLTFSRTGIKLRWNYGTDGIPDNTTDLYIRVFGIEMVYIPEGGFYVGSGGTEENHFFEGGNTSPYYVANNNEIQVQNISGALFYANAGGNGGDRIGPIPAAFPKGYNAYYVMRYEVSQEQYKDFLNTLNRTQQNTRTGTDVSTDAFSNHYVMCNSSVRTLRNSIVCLGTGHGTIDPITFYCNYNTINTYDQYDDGQNIACNYLNWGDGLAYLDWAGLRPMTELEFEKACRGMASPAPNDYPWGTEAPTAASLTISNEGEAGETVNNTGDGLCNYLQEILIVGPFRCGFAATSLTNKVQAAASYYGLMEMAGNLSERCITVGTPEGRAFTGIHGDGELSASGTADVINWPGSIGQSARGGNFLRDNLRMMVSTRSFGAYSDDLRYENVGWRGARTVD